MDKFLARTIRGSSSGMLFSDEELRKIERAESLVNAVTNDINTSENWAKIMDAVDYVVGTSSQVLLKEYVRILRKRLESSNPRVIFHALTLTEAVVKNCDKRVHREIATSKFMNQMQKLYKQHTNRRGRDHLEIADRVLELIQAWGEAFLPYQKDLPLFSGTYHDMRKKGIIFPEQYDESRAPVLTPPEKEPGDNPYDDLNRTEVIKLSKNVLEMLEDMLDASSGDLNGNEIVKELVDQCHQLEPKLVEAVELAVNSGDDNIEQYLKLNDDLHNAVKKYDQLLKEEKEGGEGKKKPSKDHPRKTSNENSVDDLLDFFSSPAVDEGAHTPASTEVVEEKLNSHILNKGLKSMSDSHLSPQSNRSSSTSATPLCIPTLQKPRSYNEKVRETKLPPRDSKPKAAPTQPPVVEKNDIDDDPFAEFTMSRINRASSAPVSKLLDDDFGSPKSLSSNLQTASTGNLPPAQLDIFSSEPARDAFPSSIPAGRTNFVASPVGSNTVVRAIPNLPLNPQTSVMPVAFGTNVSNSPHTMPDFSSISLTPDANPVVPAFAGGSSNPFDSPEKQAKKSTSDHNPFKELDFGMTDSAAPASNAFQGRGSQGSAARPNTSDPFADLLG